MITKTPIITGSRVAHPASHKLKFSDIDPGLRASFESWEWVLLDELFYCVRAIFGYRGMVSPFLEQQVFLRRFAFLNKRKEGTTIPLYTWVSEMEYAFHTEVLPDKFLPEVYIPKGWADLIIEMVEQNVIEVGVRETEHTHILVGEDRHPSFYDLTAIVQEGKETKTMWLHWRGGNSYKLHELPSDWISTKH